MADVDEIVGRPEPVAPDDWRLGLAAELVADDGTVLGKAVVVSPNIAVTTASVAGRAQMVSETPPNANANVVSGSLALTFPQYGRSSYQLPATIHGIDGELRFGVIGFFGQPSVAVPSSLLGTGELPENGAECSIIYADDPEKGFFRIAGQMENRPGGSFVLYVDKLPSDSSQLTGAPVFLENRLLGIVVGGPSHSVANTYILGVTSVRGMALSSAGSAVRALLPWIPDESRVPSRESRVESPEPSPRVGTGAKGPNQIESPNAALKGLSSTRTEVDEKSALAAEDAARDGAPTSVVSGAPSSTSPPIAQNAPGRPPGQVVVPEPFVQVEQSDVRLGAEVFGRLSQPARSALERAEGMRVAMGLKEIHMEQLVMGLFERQEGPTRRLLAKSQIDGQALLGIIREVSNTKIPASYSPFALNALPPFSEHVRKAVQAGVRRSSEQKAKDIESEHLLYGALSVAECELVKALQDRGVRKEDIANVTSQDGRRGEEQKGSATAVQPVEVFYSYSQKDVRFRKPLEKYLDILQQDGLIKSWSGGSIGAGDLAGEIADRLNAADLILLLVSPDYFASGFNVAEMNRALERQTLGQARVILIILRATDLQGTPLAGLPTVPEKSVDQWANYDEGFKHVGDELRKIIPTITVATPSPPASPPPTATATSVPSPTPSPVAVITAAPTPKVDSDMWAERDKLGYEAYARTIAALITHKETVAPLTIGIKAPWGAGKTSLMKRVQYLLDGRAELSEENRSGARQQGEPPRMKLWELWRELKRVTKSDRGTLKAEEPVRLPIPSNVEGSQYGLPPRITVWFNAWKYQTSEQIWAGMAHCIISQVTARMSALDRELFWLRLHARRINTDEVRRKATAVLVRMFVPAALMIVVACGIVIWAVAALQLALPWRWTIQGITAISGLFGVIWKAWDTLGEKAAGTMKELVREPDYEGKMGYLHLVESDIREVLGLVTEASPESRVASPEGRPESAQGPSTRSGGASLAGDFAQDDKSKSARSGASGAGVDRVSGGGGTRAGVPAPPANPLIVFVDDLDRCAPNKVAEVVEAINLFLCGDYPNCIFVLGMEPGMVAAALEVANKDVIDKAKEMGVVDSTAPVGWRFMEKIVQMPVMIPPPTKHGRDMYVESLVGAVVAPDADGTKAVAVAAAVAMPTTPSPRQDVPPPKENEVQKYVQQMKGVNLAEVEKKSLEIVAAAPAEERRAAAEAGKRVYAQTFSERDPLIANFVQECADLVEGNPRQIKRYVNVFRFYSTLRYGLRADGVAQESELPSDEVLAKFVALSIQWPHAMDCLRGKHHVESDGRMVSRLEYLEGESAKIAGNDVAGDESWKKIIEGIGPGMGPWAQARAFRTFMARKGSLGRSGGHGLW
jgi:hypothetical protein